MEASTLFQETIKCNLSTANLDCARVQAYPHLFSIRMTAHAILDSGDFEKKVELFILSFA